MQADPRHEPLPRAVGPQTYPVEAFNPLLRSLLTWGLIERVGMDDGTHRWELTDQAQTRLDELTPERRRAATTLAYLDHSCGRCRQQRLTHLVDGRYLCVDCQRIEAEEPVQQANNRRSAAAALRPRLLHGQA